MKWTILVTVLLISHSARAQDSKWEACATCHEDIVKAFARNRHANAKQGCDSCHGNTAKHAETADPAEIRNPRKLAPAAGEAICLSCHKNSPSQIGRVRSGHGKGQVACFNCHSVHTPAQPASSIAKNEKCFACHADARAQFAKPFAHKVLQGQLNCTDCHNPHGSFNGRAVASAPRHGSNEPSCYKCHTDKRGPFRFEHSPVRTESCASCHESHGSVNPRMLTRRDVSTQCLECHAALPVNTAARQVQGGLPPAFHNLRDPFYSNCTVCHSKIHGSHVNRDFLK